jgi:tetratricopeptide (TPR) repeat protein
MARNNNKQPNTGANAAGKAAAPVQKAPQSSTKAATTGSAGAKLPKDWIIAGCIAIITWLFLKVCLENQLTNWDDPGYIKDNALIKNLSVDGLKDIFSTPIMGNYHPLTILSYAIEYSYVRLDPWLYHLDSVLCHIGVTMLVYWFTKLLTKSQVAAAVAALLFGLHPMHMESVAWLAGRKDVVYGLFYMASCIAYVYYLRTQGSGRWKWYAAVTLFFICSLLGKPVAVTLPVVLFLIDYYEQRKWDKALIIEKLPLFLIAVGFGIRSMIDQKAFGSLATQNVHYNFLERTALGGYAFVTYLWKAAVPVGLSCFYPYPTKVSGGIPFQYYLYPGIALALVFAVWRFARHNRTIVFGSLFFVVNIALLLQFLPVGGAILADRYSYIPYMGLFFMAGVLVAKYFNPQHKTQLGYLALFIAGAYTLGLGYLSNERCKDWYDTTSLWRDEIEQQPEAPNAFNNLGFNYFNKFNESVNTAEKKVCYDSAFYLLNRAIQLQPSFANPYVSLGELQRASGKFPEAKAYYYQGLALNDKEGNANAYLGLAIIYCITHNFDSARTCFKNAIGFKAYFPEAYSNFGNFYDMMGIHDSSLVQYGIAIAQNPDMYAPYLNRGRELHRMQRCPEAMKDFEKALELRPEMGEVYYSRSYCYTASGQKAQALQDVEKALSLGFTNIDPAYYKMLKGGR